MLSKESAILEKDPEYFENLLRAMTFKYLTGQTNFDPFMNCLIDYYGLNQDSEIENPFKPSIYKSTDRSTILETTINDKDKKKILVLLKLILKAN